MLTIKFQAAFRRDYKRIVRRGYDVRLLENVVQLLADESRSRKRTATTRSPATISAAASATSRRTGC